MLATLLAEFFATEPSDFAEITATEKSLTKPSRYAPDTLASIMDAWLVVARQMMDALKALAARNITLNSDETATFGKTS
jgi:hypothetical protein